MKKFMKNCRRSLALVLALALGMVLTGTMTTEAAVTAPNISTRDFWTIVREMSGYSSWRVNGQSDGSLVGPWQDRDSGDTIEEVINTMTNSPYEIAAAFDCDTGEKILEGTNLMRDSVLFTCPEGCDSAALDYYHCHPAEDGGFSPEDLQAAAAIGYHSLSAVCWDVIFTVSPNCLEPGGTIIVGPDTGANGWPNPEELAAYYQEQIDKALKMKRFTFTAEWADVLAALDSGEKWYTEVLGGKFLITHYAMLQTAEKFDLKYEVTSRRPNATIKGSKGKNLLKISFDNPFVFKATKKVKHPTIRYTYY